MCFIFILTLVVQGTLVETQHACYVSTDNGLPLSAKFHQYLFKHIIFQNEYLFLYSDFLDSLQATE